MPKKLELFTSQPHNFQNRTPFVLPFRFNPLLGHHMNWVASHQFALLLRGRQQLGTERVVHPARRTEVRDAGTGRDTWDEVSRPTDRRGRVVTDPVGFGGGRSLRVRSTSSRPVEVGGTRFGSKGERLRFGSCKTPCHGALPKKGRLGADVLFCVLESLSLGVGFRGSCLQASQRVMLKVSHCE